MQATTLTIDRSDTDDVSKLADEQSPLPPMNRASTLARLQNIVNCGRLQHGPRAQSRRAEASSTFFVNHAGSDFAASDMQPYLRVMESWELSLVSRDIHHYTNDLKEATIKQQVRALYRYS